MVNELERPLTETDLQTAVEEELKQIKRKKNTELKMTRCMYSLKQNKKKQANSLGSLLVRRGMG
jgi:hypothetical protein